MKLKKFLASIFCTAMVLSTMGIVAFAADVTIEADYTAQNGDVLSGGTGIEIITVADDAEITLSGVNVQRITLEGDAVINLADNTTNDVNANGAKDGAVVVPKGGSLVINGDTGVLNAAKSKSGSWSAAIGSDRWGGYESVTITINGGVINAEANYAAAIGGGQNRPATVTINGGTINAKSDYGAAIGGGQTATATVSITNGTVDAVSSRGAAIGAGQEADATVTISGGTVSAQGLFGAAIGAGTESTGTTTVSIANADVTATVDPATHTSKPSSTRGITSAAIGSSTGKAEITITDSTVNATSVNAPAIGGGLNSTEKSSVVISGESNVAVMVSAPDVEIENSIGNATGEVNVTVDENASIEDLAVAKIGSASFKSIEDAVAALEEGDTLKIATGEYEGFDILVDNVTITGMTDDTVLTITAIPGNAFIGINAEGVSIEDLTFVVSEGYEQTGDYLDGFDAVIGYWSNNFNAGSDVTTGYDVTGCTFINKSTTMGAATYNFSSFEITGNTFENFNVAIHTMSDGSAMGEVVIEGNTFVKVNEPINVYWGRTSSTPNSIEITGNDFVSAKDADEIKITVHDYASHETGTAGIDSIEITGNTFGSETEVVLVDTASDVTAGVEEDLANTQNVVIDKKYATVARVGNDKYYTTLDDAIKEAAGAEITLLNDAELNTKLDNATININLNGYKMAVNVGSNYIIGDNSICNGTIDISNASSPQNIFGLAQYASPATSLTMDNVTFIGDGYNSGYAVFEIGNSGADVELTITNSTIDLKNDNADQGGFVKGYKPNSVITLTNTEITLDNTDMFAVNVIADVTDSEITASNLTAAALRNFGGSVNNSEISITNSLNGIRNTDGYALNVTNGSSITVSGSTNTEEGKIGDLVLSAGNTIDVDTTSELVVEKSAIADNDDVTGNIVSKADIIYIQYRKTDCDAAGEDNNEKQDVYEIVLAGAYEEKINELASADITFKFVGTPVKGASISYSVDPAEGVTLSQIGKTDRYMFNYDGITKYEETGVAIVIGTITVEGYGSYYLGTATENVDTNAVYATEIVDSIVEGFDEAATLVVNKDMDEADDMVGEFDGVEIIVPTRKLTINIDFPNEVTTDNAVEYQQMTVTVSGGDLEEALVIKLGNNADITDLAKFVSKTSANKDVTATAGDNKYTVEITALLTLDKTYNVKIEGAGYRTVRHTVNMSTEKTLNFWNNVKDKDEVVEKDERSEKVTYLAGDIVKDGTINIYDLSAVVSYFGEVDLSESNKAEYAKYDLNRDGKIDSKDVAYVLVSWGK